jgi:hypothetical protein
MADGSPQREELMAWFLEHKDELVPILGADAFLPSGGVEGQHLVKSADGYTWEDPPPTVSFPLDGTDGAVITLPTIPSLPLDASDPDQVANVPSGASVGTPTSRSIVLDTYYTPNAEKPVFVSATARLYIPSAYEGDPGIGFKLSDPNNRAATEKLLGSNRVQHTAGEPDWLIDQQLFGVVPAGWEYRFQKIGQFTGSNAPSLSILTAAYEQIIG